MTWQATLAHKRSYEEPISGSAGDVFKIGKRGDWQGHSWIWCTNQAGLEGWVAEAILTMNHNQAILKEDFNALELSVAKCEQLHGSRQLAGWVWLTNSQQQSGWVPLNCVKGLSNA